MNAIAYELIKDEQKAFPVVSSISEIEGSTAIAVAAELMSNERGGKGLLLGGVAGISPTEVLILGAGITGTVAARTALALGHEVKIFDHDITKLRKIQHYLGQQVFTSVIHPAVLFKGPGISRCSDWEFTLYQWFRTIYDFGGIGENYENRCCNY